MLAAIAHDGQYRRTGEAYVFHPINVAMILANIDKANLSTSKCKNFSIL
jgi:(p)ppGpp synthase/HD superfamily hydrolase